MRTLVIAVLLFASQLVFARAKIQGWCEDGNNAVATQGLNSTTKVQRSYPSCTVTVYSPAGGVTIATIYSDSGGTAKANPFTAAASGQWFFYIDTPTCDVAFSGGGISTPFTKGGLCGSGPNWRTENFSGATVGARIAACLTALPSTGGVCDALFDNTTLTITSNPFSGITKPFKLLLGGYNYATDVSLVLTNTGQVIEGVNQGATQIWSSASFPVAATITLTGCTNATPIVCTANAAHNLSVNDLVQVVGETGNTAANGPWRVSVVGGGGTTFTLEGGIGNAADTGSGTAFKITPIIKFLNNSSPIFGAGLQGITLNCGSAGSVGTPVAGCAPITAQGLQNESFLTNLYLYSPTVGIFLGNSTGQNSTLIEIDRIDAINISAGAEGIHQQSQNTRVTNFVPNSESNIQGLIGIHVLGSPSYVANVGGERVTDVVRQEANILLTLEGVVGLDHASPDGRVTNILATRAGDYHMQNIVASAGTGSTPNAIVDSSRSFTINGSRTAIHAGSAAAATIIPPLWIGAGEKAGLYAGTVDATNSMIVAGFRPTGVTGAQYFAFHFGGTQADANPTALFQSCDSDKATNCQTYFSASRANGGSTAGFPLVLNAATYAEAALKAAAGFSSNSYASNTVCYDAAGAAACAAAPIGSVVIDAAATTVVVSTTIMGANSQVFIQEDPSLATRLGITCNTTTGRTYTVTARTAATSFTITASAAPSATPACLSYSIVN